VACPSLPDRGLCRVGPCKVRWLSSSTCPERSRCLVSLPCPLLTVLRPPSKSCPPGSPATCSARPAGSCPDWRSSWPQCPITGARRGAGMLWRPACPGRAGPARGQRPAPEHPGKRAVAEVAGQRRRRDGDHRAAGMGHAVAGHPGAGHPGQPAPAASPYHQQIPRAAGHVDQNPARRAALDPRLHQRILADLPPDRGQHGSQLLTGQVMPLLTQEPVVAMVTVRRGPGQHGNQGRVMGAGHRLPVPQCLQAARRAARPDNHAADARHRLARFLSSRSATAAWPKARALPDRPA
jgi:hypothetical protein